MFLEANHEVILESHHLGCRKAFNDASSRVFLHQRPPWHVFARRDACIEGLLLARSHRQCAELRLVGLELENLWLEACWQGVQLGIGQEHWRIAQVCGDVIEDRRTHGGERCNNEPAGGQDTRYTQRLRAN